MSRKALVLTGNRYGRLSVLGREESDNKKNSMWNCICMCGVKVIVGGSHLKNGHIQSCGCLRKEVTSKRSLKHSHAKNKIDTTTTYHAWQDMRKRCTNPNRKEYKNYGGRGINVCDRWTNSFENFLEDMGERPEGLSIDRIDNNGNYEPSNCRWATKKEQCGNKRNNKWITWNGITKIQEYWSREWNLSRRIITYNISQGYSMEWIYQNKVEPKLSPSTVQARMMLVV